MESSFGEVVGGLIGCGIIIAVFAGLWKLLEGDDNSSDQFDGRSDQGPRNF
jgi:hypothetical protein